VSEKYEAKNIWVMSDRVSEKCGAKNIWVTEWVKSMEQRTSKDDSL